MILENFLFFINYVFPVFILVLGLLGNVIGFIVVLSKKLKNIGPTHIFCYMFASDTAYLIQIIITYLYYAFGIHISVYSRLSCKIWVYLNYALGNILKFNLFLIK